MGWESNQNSGQLDMLRFEGHKQQTTYWQNAKYISCGDTSKVFESLGSVQAVNDSDIATHQSW